jgi:pentatricopeptide repeat protein
MYFSVMKVFGKEGRDDHAMDIYKDCLKDDLDLSSILGGIVI